MPLIEYIGGPLDGQVQEVKELPHFFETAQIKGFSGAPNENVKIAKGRYYREAHTRFGDPYQYRWKGYL